MSYTAYTAVILTFHHLSFAVMTVLALIASSVAYWLIVRKQKYRLLITIIVFILALIAAGYFTEEVFLRAPLSFEIVQTS